MFGQLKIEIRKATPTEDPIIAEHFHQMWLDIGVPPESIRSNWFDLTVQFIENARKELSYNAFFAVADGKIVGSSSCQLFAGLYPNILAADIRQYGYIWGVYVEAEYRHRGIGSELVGEAIAYLKSLGCTKAVLHTAPLAKSLYSHMGFEDGNQMELDLS
ncbi:MAG: GNAT family N-acetyltransferase [Cyanobacteriota bacterium]|nr:GNAT family N-acetyltransferase [Cyanobacteriota bacterium]